MSGQTRHIAYGAERLGMSYATSLFDQSRVYFTHEFIVAPTTGWTIDPSASECKYVRRNQIDHWHLLHPQGCSFPMCMRGVLVRSLDPHRIWRLTGDYDLKGNGYEGVWPD